MKGHQLVALFEGSKIFKRQGLVGRSLVTMHMALKWIVGAWPLSISFYVSWPL